MVTLTVQVLATTNSTPIWMTCSNLIQHAFQPCARRRQHAGPTGDASGQRRVVVARRRPIDRLQRPPHCRLSVAPATRHADRHQVPASRLRRVDLEAFQHDIRSSPLYNFSWATSTEEYVQLFNGKMWIILDTHVPLKSRTRRVGRNDCRWLTDEARDAKRRCRRLERRYRRSLPTTRPAFTPHVLPRVKPSRDRGLTPSPDDLPTSPATVPPPGE